VKKKETHTTGSITVKIATFPLTPNVLLKTIHICIMIGSTYTSEYHKHPFTFVQKTKESPECQGCRNPFDDVALECSQCKISILPVKVHGPYSLSKNALREEGCPWLIKSTRQGSLSNVGHFNTPPHVLHLWPNTCSTTGGKSPSLSKEPALIPCKTPWALLTLKRCLLKRRSVNGL
jgi:hypothetical protein